MYANLQESLEVLSDQSAGQRFILAGSFGRAAILGDSTFPALHGSTERDVDVIDTDGRAYDKYEFSDASPVDCLLTRSIHPIAGTTDWGLYDRHELEAGAIVTIPSELLGIHDVELPFAPGFGLATFNACMHVALRDANPEVPIKNMRHASQYRRIAKSLMHGGPDNCSCVELGQVFGEYRADLREKYPHSVPERVYVASRSLLRMAAPNTFHSLSAGRLGHAVQRFRGTSFKAGSDVSIHDVPVFQPK